MIDLFDLFVDFSNYLGIVRAAVMVILFFLLTAAYDNLPVLLEKKNNKLSRILLKDIGVHK